MKGRFSEEDVENKLRDGVRRIMKAMYGLKRIGDDPDIVGGGLDRELNSVQFG